MYSSSSFEKMLAPTMKLCFDSALIRYTLSNSLSTYMISIDIIHLLYYFEIGILIIISIKTTTTTKSHQTLGSVLVICPPFPRNRWWFICTQSVQFSFHRVTQSVVTSISRWIWINANAKCACKLCMCVCVWRANAKTLWQSH